MNATTQTVSAAAAAPGARAGQSLPRVNATSILGPTRGCGPPAGCGPPTG